MPHHRIPHPFAPPYPGGTPTEELIDRHAHLVAVGLANCRAAQALQREITRRKIEQRNAELESKAALLSNDDDNNHFNPKEHRDGDGKWTTGPDASGSKANASVAAQAKGAPLKFGAGLNQGLQQVASNIGQGMAQLSDPGALKDNFSTFLQAQDEALGMVPNPHFDPLTGEVSNDDLYEQARWRMFEQREIERERLRAPWESFSQAAAEVAAEFGHLKDTTPGPNWVGTAGEMTGETLGYAAPSAIPVVGQVTGPAVAALASIGDTFNQAYDAYKKRGLPDDQAREMARKVAIDTGVATGLIFALPIGRLASLPKPVLSQMLLAMGISGAQLSADKLQSMLQAKATFNPNLTLADFARETGNSFLMGAIVSGSLHGAQRISAAQLARLRGTTGQEPTPKTPAELTKTEQQQKVKPDEPEEENNRANQGASRADEALVAEAAAYLRRSGEAVPSLQGDSGEIQRQGAALQKWARATGRLNDGIPPTAKPLDGAGEHQVFFDPQTNRVYKSTYPGSFGLAGKEYWLERATPYFYLRRIALMNQVFGSDIRVEGVTSGENPSIITSQPYHDAYDKNSPHPSEKEIAEFMRSQGFESHPTFEYGWVRKADGITALDAKPDNFIKTKDGIVPVDLIMQEEPRPTNPHDQ